MPLKGEYGASNSGYNGISGRKNKGYGMINKE